MHKDYIFQLKSPFQIFFANGVVTCVVVMKCEWLVFCDLSLKSITPIKICIDLRLFSKFLVEPFLRPLKAKDV